jgi:hypothetical protein
LASEPRKKILHFDLVPRRRLLNQHRYGIKAVSDVGYPPHRVTYSLHDGGSHGMNLAMAGMMHPKTSCASIIWNWLSSNLGDWMTFIV